MTLFYYTISGIIFIYTYWLIPTRYRKWLLSFASALFFTSFHWSFFFLHLSSALVNYVAADLVSRKYHRKIIISLTLGFNIIFIFYHKLVSLTDHNYIIPVGISYYTFMNLSYVLDIYKDEYLPIKKFSDFYVFSSFFPCQLMGPIENIKHLLPQILEKNKINWNSLSMGFCLISLGLFKKLVIADRLHDAVHPNNGHIFNYIGFELWVFYFFCLVQIYCDFSSYIDISRGFAKFLNIDLFENFKQPYLAKNVAEVWQRWNITLVNWLRNYVYTPILWKTKNIYLSVLITMLLIGVWHRISWQMALWGLYWAFLYWIHIFCRVKGFFLFKNVYVSRFITILLMSFSTVFISSDSLYSLTRVVRNTFTLYTNNLFTRPFLSIWDAMIIVASIVLMVGYEYYEANQNPSSSTMCQRNRKLLNISLGLLGLFFTALLGVSKSQAYIYMRF